MLAPKKAIKITQIVAMMFGVGASRTGAVHLARASRSRRRC
jgi:hypothetical protein